MEHLMHTRDLLKTTLHQSRQIHSQIHTSCDILSRINQTLEATVQHAVRGRAGFVVKDHVHRAIPLVLAVLNVNQLVSELGALVSAHSCSDDLARFIYHVKRFKQALVLLTNTCKLAIPWVRNVEQSLEQSTGTSTALVGVVKRSRRFVHDLDHPYYSGVCKTLRLLEELQGTEERCLLDQGILGVAFTDLEGAFENLLIENSLPVQVPSSLFSSGDEESDASGPLPQPAFPFRVVESLEAIMACFSTCDRPVDRCVSIYVTVRTTTIATSVQGLGLDYLDIALTEFDSVQAIEGYVDEWARHLEFVVKHLLELEYTLCDLVFGELEVAQNDCFAAIALESRIQDFIKFASAITKGKKEAIKLFKLLDVFAVLDNLRHDFNRLFGGNRCSEIRTRTRELIKNVVNGVFEIFVELSAQVKLQRLMDPPPDGAVPRLVSFVTEFCDELLDDEYRLVLDQVLEIHRTWCNVHEPTRGLATVEVLNIMKSLELNLETWTNRYEDTALSRIFAMNTSCYLSKRLKGTRLGELMGESWLKRHEDRVEYQANLYLKDCWEKIPSVLTDKDRMITATDRIKGFTKAFDEAYRKQTGWVLCDDDLRWKTCELIARVVVAAYKRYMDEYLGSQSPNMYVKYSVEKVESMVSCMFKPKEVSNSNSKYRNLMGKMINSVVAGTTINAA